MASTKFKARESGYRAEMDEAERASRDEIMALQSKRLAWSLQHAYDNVAHYRKAFDKAGVHPADFKEHSDLARFPFTVKTDLRDNYPFNMFAVEREKLVRGDLVFWKGHVAIMTDAKEMIHANGHTMLVSREGLKDAIARIGYLYGGPTGFRRP